MAQNALSSELLHIRKQLDGLAHARMHWGDLTPRDEHQWSELCVRERELIAVGAGWTLTAR